MKWGWMVPGMVSVEKVADNFRKLGYDVRVTLADGKEVHIIACFVGGVERRPRSA
jgi:hypothetical protein